MPKPPLRSVLITATAAAVVMVTLSAQERSPLAYDLIWSREQVAARVNAINQHLPYVPGELLVKFKPGMAPTEQLHALRVLKTSSLPASTQWIGDILQVRVPAEENAEAAAAVLAQQGEVEWAQPNYVTRPHAVPNDPSYSLQWNFPAINLPAAWDINRGASNAVTVAVIDTGVTSATAIQSFPLWDGPRIGMFSIPYAQNPDIVATRFVAPRDFVFWNGPVVDMVGHGTHVAGTVLEETNNSFGLAGVAYNARLMPLKVCIGYWEYQILTAAYNLPGVVNPSFEGGCDTASAVAAVRYAADNGAQVVNMSFGGPDASPALLDALRYAVGRGVFVTIAAGNQYLDGNPVEYPAAYAPQIDGVMTVGAVGKSSLRAYYSNTGSYVEIAAPGGDDRDAGGNYIYQETLYPPDSDQHAITVPRFDRYVGVGYEGTSMASPHVAGVAALLYSQGITNPAAIEAALKRFAKDLGAPGRDDEYGSGLIDARAALRGFGVTK